MGEGRRRGRPADPRHGDAVNSQSLEPAGAAPADEADTSAAESLRRRSSGEASGGGALLRVWWMGLGNAVFIFAAVYVAIGGRGWRLSGTDLVFWLTVLTLLGARFLDISRYRGATASGEPATMAHWRRYAVLLLLISVAVWGGGHLVSVASAG